MRNLTCLGRFTAPGDVPVRLTANDAFRALTRDNAIARNWFHPMPSGGNIIHGFV